MTSFFSALASPGERDYGITYRRANSFSAMVVPYDTLFQRLILAMLWLVAAGKGSVFAHPPKN
jgi:hypothetical protein